MPRMSGSGSRLCPELPPLPACPAGRPIVDGEAVSVVDRPTVSFGSLLRRLRAEADLTQEELAGAAGLSARSVSDLERGVNLTARRDTARLLADALGLSGEARAGFELAARGKLPGGPVASTGPERSGPAWQSEAGAP